MRFEEISMPIAINCMHNKIAIIDDDIVISGSYNWTNNARYNYENVLIEKRLPYEIELLKYEINHIKKQNDITKHISNCKIDCPLCNAQAKIILIKDDDYKLLVSQCSSGHIKKISGDYNDTNDYLFGELQLIHERYCDCNVDDYNYRRMLELRETIEENNVIENYIINSNLPIACIMCTGISNNYHEYGERILNTIWQDKYFSPMIQEFSEYEALR